MSKILKQSKLWAISLLLVSSKFSEVDIDIPYIDEFRKASEDKYTYNSIVRCEKEI